jgi:hypothetical protein
MRAMQRLSLSSIGWRRRAGERRDHFSDNPSPRSSPHSFLRGERRKMSNAPSSFGDATDSDRQSQSHSLLQYSLYFLTLF